MERRKDVKQTEYYQQQAFACAAASLVATNAEVRQAYLSLEAGWLCLAPRAKESSDGAGSAPKAAMS